MAVHGKNLRICFFQHFSIQKITKLSTPSSCLVGIYSIPQISPRFPTQFTQLARSWLLIKFSSVTVSPACPTSSNSQLQLPVFSEGCSLAHSMNLHAYPMKPKYKAANSVQHIFTSKKGDTTTICLSLSKENSNAEKHSQMHKHMQCTCSSHCCEKWGTFQLLPRVRTDSDGTQISISSNKAKMIARSTPDPRPPVAPPDILRLQPSTKQMGWEGTELPKSTKKGESQNGRMPNDLKRKEWDLYQLDKMPRCWLALKTNADARMPKGRLSNCCPNQWTSMTITGFTACICWDPQVFKPIFSKLMLVGDVDGSCGSYHGLTIYCWNKQHNTVRQLIDPQVATLPYPAASSLLK